jgi:hypothetical protein
MKIDFLTARALCTASELALLQDTRPKSLTGFPIGELKKKAALARKYADKWREQAKRGGNSKDGAAARSQQKYELFREALTRLEARIARIEKPAPPAKKAVKKTAPPKPAKKAAKKTAKVSIKSRKEPALALSKRANQQAITTNRRMETSGLTSRIRGHVSARGRRNQAARSSRKRS